MVRRFAAPLIAALLIAALSAGCAHAPVPTPEAPPARHFRILQVNDTYKIEGLEKGSVGGFARLRTLRRQLEEQGQPVLLLHGGDFLYPSIMSKYLRAEPMVRILNLMDGDAAAFDPNLIVTFGNHEFDNPDPGVVLGRIAQSDFSWVSSNTGYRSSREGPAEEWGRRFHNVHPVLLRELGGVRVGLFGITLDAEDQDYVAYRYAPDERHRLVRDAIDRLRRQGAEVIIALTHQDLDQDEWLAREFPEISLIAGGHEHFFIKEPVGDTWITKADADNQSAIVHEVTLVSGASPRIESRRVTLDASVAKDAVIQGEVERYLAKLDRTIKSATGHDGGEVVCHTVQLLEGVETAIRRRETALGNFLADTIRQRMRTDVAFVNGGGIRINDNIPPGPLTEADMDGIFYFDDALVSFRLTGQQLLDVLRNSVSKAHLGDGRFLQVAGIRFRYHRSGDEHHPTYRIDPDDVTVQRSGAREFRPLDLGASYSAGTTDFILESGYKDGYALFQRGKGGSSPARLEKGPPPDFRAVVQQAMARLPMRRITSRVDGRIVEAPSH